MGAYIRRRALTTIPVVLGVSLAVFLMLHFLPGDPVLLMLTEHRGGAAPTVSGNITQEMYDNMRHQLGLDRPLPVQFFSFLGGVVRGDLGTSFRGGESVTDLILRNLPWLLAIHAGIVLRHGLRGKARVVFRLYRDALGGSLRMWRKRRRIQRSRRIGTAGFARHVSRRFYDRGYVRNALKDLWAALVGRR